MAEALEKRTRETGPQGGGAEGHLGVLWREEPRQVTETSRCQGRGRWGQLPMSFGPSQGLELHPDSSEEPQGLGNPRISGRSQEGSAPPHSEGEDTLGQKPQVKPLRLGSYR